MKSLNLGLSTLMLVGMMSYANAQQSVYQNPEQCKAEVGALDMNADGYVDATEMGDRGTIQTNVDTDGDGQISRDEMVVACDNSLVEALEGGDSAG
jgi:Ca2+-binding EF-hand superfamily protein